MCAVEIWPYCEWMICPKDKVIDYIPITQLCRHSAQSVQVHFNTKWGTAFLIEFDMILFSVVQCEYYEDITVTWFTWQYAYIMSMYCLLKSSLCIGYLGPLYIDGHGLVKQWDLNCKPLMNKFYTNNHPKPCLYWGLYTSCHIWIQFGGWLLHHSLACSRLPIHRVMISIIDYIAEWIHTWWLASAIVFKLSYLPASGSSLSSILVASLAGSL